MVTKPPKAPKNVWFYICLVLGGSYLISGFNNFFSGNIEAFEMWWLPLIPSVLLLIAAVFLRIRYKREREKYQTALEQYNAELQQLKEDLDKKAEDKKRRQEEWERTHGRIFTKIKGVTFSNEDGTSRQKLLKDALADECFGSIALELYDYKGQDAIKVLYDDECIGNIPRELVPQVKEIMPKISAAHLDVSRFTPDDEDEDDRQRDYIYRADITIVYTKEPKDATESSD